MVAYLSSLDIIHQLILRQLAYSILNLLVFA